MQRPTTRGAHRACAILLTAAAIAAATAGSAPGARADTASDLANATAAVEQLQETAAAAHERHEAAQAQLDQVSARLADLDQSLQAAEAVVADSHKSLGRAARARYIAGGVEGSLLLLLTADQRTFGRGLHDLRRLGDAAATDLDTAISNEATLSSIRSSIAQEQVLANRLTQEAARAAQEAADALLEAERRERELQQRYAVELAALRAAQEEQSRQAAAAALAQLAQAATPPPATDPQSPAAPAPAGARDQLVTWALGKVGSRYVTNGEGPNSFDCSGFVTAAYATIGVSVPSYTGAQADRVTKVSLAEAKPGDLLFFFGRGAQHVAIAIGNGRMVHAANPSRGVTINNVADPWYRERFTMAGRLID